MISKHRIIKTILKDQDFNKSIKLLSSEISKSQARLKRKAGRILRVMAADYDPNMVSILHKIARWILSYIYSGIETNRDGLEKIRETSRNSTVILVPSHKSHVDYIVISYLFYLNKIIVPLIASGINLSFWPLGYFFRKGGAFFIKRKIKDDRLYSLVLKFYLKALYERKYTQEVFLEGTRSRSGKLLYPKTGILSMIIDNFIHSRTKIDVTFIPVSINYERVVEEKSFGDEQRGVGKTKETLINLIRSVKFLKGKYGKIYVYFGHPISLRDNIDVKKSDDHSVRESAHILGQRLIKSIGNIMTITTSSLLATSILTYRNNGTSSDELLNRIKFLNSYLELKRAPITGSATNISAHIEEILDLFKSSGSIFQYEDREGKIFIPKRRHRLRMSYYKNSAIHYFVEAAIIISIIRRLKLSKIDDIYNHYQKIIKMFRNEFVGIESYKDNLLVNISELQKLGVVEINGENVTIRDSLPIDIIEMADSILQSYFEGFYIVSNVLKNYDKESLPDDILKRFHESGLRLYYKGRIKCFDAITQPIFKNVLSFYTPMSMEEISTENEYLSKFLIN